MLQSTTMNVKSCLCSRSKSACPSRRRAATPSSRCSLTFACSASTTWRHSGARSRSQSCVAMSRWRIFTTQEYEGDNLVTQEYENLVESSQQYQHLDNPIYRVCIERASNAGGTIVDNLDLFTYFQQDTWRSAVSTIPQRWRCPSRSRQTSSRHPSMRKRRRMMMFLNSRLNQYQRINNER